MNKRTLDQTDALAAVLGDDPSEGELRHWLDKAGGDVSGAVNLYYDNGPIASFKRVKSSGTQYMGEYMVQAYAMTSTNALGTRLRVEACPTKNRQTTPKEWNTCILRLVNEQGREIGRLPKESALFLQDFYGNGCVDLEANVLDAAQRVKTGDGFIVRIGIHLKEDMFALMGNMDMYDDALKKKRVDALYKLIDACNLRPKRRGVAVQRPSLQDNLRDLTMEDDDLNDQDVNLLYQRAMRRDVELVCTQPPAAFALDLRDYQKQALTWMLQHETRLNGCTDDDLHAMWEEYAFPSTDDCFYLNPFTGEMRREFPKASDQCRGGILADEMGLGKTIETLALVHANPHMGEGCKTTLVVCPMSLLSQWEDECKRSTTDTIRVQTYYTAGRNIRHALSTPPDVLITTYGTLQSEHAQSKRALGGPTLFDVEFHRVILDEAHIIKSPSTAIAQACYKLQSRHRWALTGTPIQNKLDDLFSLVHFLRREPWNSNSVWNRLITLPFQRKDPKALQTVQRVMEPIVLRRTKESRDLNGVPLLQLPPKAIQVVYLDFSRQEREIYDMLHKYSKSTFSTLCAAGSVMSNWAHILSLLLRLRQACNHPMLVTSMFNKERAVGQPVELEVLMERFKDTTYAKSVIQGLHDDTVKECPVCLEEMLSMVVLPCAHVTCRDCMHEFLDKREEQGLDGECPVCRVGLDISQLALVTPPSPSTPTANVTGSTKMNALVQAIRNHPPNTKCVVFSQFTSMLNLIQRALDHASISHTRLDGDLSHKDRQIVLTTFKSTTVNVLLISLRAGGVGLNLTHASRVYMMDPWWNWSIEAQAIDRVHRFGQLHAVQVIRFIMRDSVEERMLHIQDRKRVLTGSALRDKDELERVEELNMLFQ